MATLIATRDLSGQGYLASPGQRFEVADDVAESLISRGLAVPYREPVDRGKFSTYETKVVVPEFSVPELKLNNLGRVTWDKGKRR
jgi:hypothetical protein